MKAEEILQAALERGTPAERAAYLDGACGADTKLRSLVEGLLRAREAAGRFLEQPLFASSPTVDEPNAEQGGGQATSDEARVEQPGTRIGPYKLLQQIGEGGMGVVYMAEQEQPVRRKVALK